MGEETGGQTASEAPGNQPEPPAASSVLAPPPRPPLGATVAQVCEGTEAAHLLPRPPSPVSVAGARMAGLLGDPGGPAFPWEPAASFGRSPCPQHLRGWHGPSCPPCGSPVFHTLWEWSHEGGLHRGPQHPESGRRSGQKRQDTVLSTPGQRTAPGVPCLCPRRHHAPPSLAKERLSPGVLQCPSGGGGGPGSPAPPRAHLSAPEDTPWGVPVCVLRSDRGSGPPSTRRLVLVPSRPWKELPGVAPRGQVRGGGAHGRTSPRRPSAGAAGRAEAPPATTWPPAALPVQVPARLGGDAGA